MYRRICRLRKVQMNSGDWAEKHHTDLMLRSEAALLRVYLQPTFINLRLKLLDSGLSRPRPTITFPVSYCHTLHVTF